MSTPKVKMKFQYLEDAYEDYVQFVANEGSGTEPYTIEEFKAQWPPFIEMPPSRNEETF